MQYGEESGGIREFYAMGREPSHFLTCRSLIFPVRPCVFTQAERMDEVGGMNRTITADQQLDDQALI